MAKLLRDIEEADAWWSGDPDKLTDVYTTAATREQRPGRRFWERPNDTTSVRPAERVHAPVASDIAVTGADLLFGADLEVQIPEAHGDTPDQAAVDAENRLAELWDQAAISNTLLEAAEVAGGLGGVYLVPTWDREVAGHPLLNVVHADRAVPEWRGDRLHAVTFWHVVQVEGLNVWRHLERHEPGAILHGLYAGSRTHLGVPMNLQKHPATKGLPEVVPTTSWQVPGGILARYVPNVKPNRRHRGLPVGRSDTQGLESLMDSLDLTMTSWARDIRLGQRRIIVPNEFLRRSGRGSGASFDVDQEVFAPLDIDPGNMEKAGITLVDFSIRADEHAATATDLFQRIVSSAGYSPQSFGMQGDGAAITATEVNAHESRSGRTTARKQRYWGPELAAAAVGLLIVDREVFSSGVAPWRPTVGFPDRDQADEATVAQTLGLIEMARAASIETKVRMLHPEWEQPQVDAEVALIKAEQGVAVDPTGGFP